MDLLWFYFVLILLGVGGVRFCLAMEGLPVAFLTGSDMLVGREVVGLDPSFDPSNPWRYLGRSIFSTVGGGGAVFLGLMMVAGAFGVASRCWYRNVIGR